MSESDEVAASVTYEYQGRAWSFAADVVEIQRRWNAANQACERLGRATDPESLAAYQAVWDERMAATHAKLNHPWIAALGVEKHQADPVLRACAAQY
jgi:hypothetical protein